MKKFTVLILIHLIAILQSCCGNVEFTTYFITIERVRGLFYSFDENGIFPYLDEFNRNELGVTITADSTTERIEISHLIRPFINSAFACQDPTETIFENEIVSINVFSKYPFDDEFMGGDKVNDILEPLDILGQTTSGIDINRLSFISQQLKFSRIPKYDSMQFIITGIIQQKGTFSFETELVILTD